MGGVTGGAALCPAGLVFADFGLEGLMVHGLVSGRLGGCQASKKCRKFWFKQFA